MKRKRHRIVSMLTRMAMKAEGIAETAAGYRVENDGDYEHEHRVAEHEAKTEPEPGGGPERAMAEVFDDG
jgi:hypothetical protein